MLDTTFGALADPTRRAILARLAQGEASVTELAEPFRVSLPAISKHLRVLEGAGLLKREIDGRVHRCRLAPEPMKGAAAWIDFYRAYWERQLNALAKYLEETAGAGSPSATLPAATENEPGEISNKEQDTWPHERKPTPHRSSKSGGRSPRRGKGSSKPGPTKSS